MDPVECARCQSRIFTENRTCPTCGAALFRPSAPLPRPSTATPAVVVAIVAVAIIGAIAVALARLLARH